MLRIGGRLESRHGADEVRTDWFFEIGGDAPGMYSGGDLTGLTSTHRSQNSLNRRHHLMGVSSY